MRLAILVTNTDRSAFAARHPRDGEKFAALFADVRPGWQTTAFETTAGELPGLSGRYEAAIITGSPASVHDGAAWIAALEDWIRAAHAARLPMFGACFGHQAIATALGGAVTPNPGPFALGRVEVEITARPPFMADAPARIALYAAHGEQVTRLPDGARPWCRAEGCEIGGFTLGDRIFTTEYHPEMSPGFIAALVEELADKLPAETIARARASLDRPADGRLVADWAARLFEAANDVADT